MLHHDEDEGAEHHRAYGIERLHMHGVPCLSTRTLGGSEKRRALCCVRPTRHPFGGCRARGSPTILIWTRGITPHQHQRHSHPVHPKDLLEELYLTMPLACRRSISRHTAVLISSRHYPCQLCLVLSQWICLGQSVPTCLRCLD